MREKTYYLENDSFYYVRVKNLIWVSCGLRSPSNLEESACNLLRDIVTSFTDFDKPVIIDFKGVNEVVDHAIDNFLRDIKANPIPMLFLDATSIEYKLNNALAELIPSEGFIEIENNRSLLALFYKRVAQRKYTYKKLREICTSLIKSEVINASNAAYEKFSSGMKPLSSTPIYASGLFNSNKIISNNRAFVWVCCALSDKLEEIIQSYKLGTNNELPKLLCVSLRSAPFTSVVGMMNGINFETIDHLGPVEKFYESDSMPNLTTKCEYLYIGDFTFGGTEIKIAKAFMKAKGATLKHALVIGSLFHPSLFEHSFILHPLIQLMSVKEIKAKARYSLFKPNV